MQSSAAPGPADAPAEAIAIVEIQAPTLHPLVPHKAGRRAGGGGGGGCRICALCIVPIPHLGLMSANTGPRRSDRPSLKPPLRPPPVTTLPPPVTPSGASDITFKACLGEVTAKPR